MRTTQIQHSLPRIMLEALVARVALQLLSVPGMQFRLLSRNSKVEGLRYDNAHDIEVQFCS